MEPKLNRELEVLQHGATKAQRGLDVVILGGPRGDIPIEPGAGAVVADFVADETVSTVIALRKSDGAMWSAGERIRFVTDYAMRLFQRQGERRIPLLQVVDEAGRFCPQNPGKGDVEIAKCIGAIEQLVEWGRNVGVGVALLTQRSARMAKAVSELADCMIGFCTVGPNSVSAIADWFGEHVPKDRQKVLVEQLRQLERGTALVVSPGWLGFEGTARMRARETFDSSSTPAPGKSLRAPGQAQKPDLEKYRERMAETIERAKAEDPKALRAEIEQLKRRVARGDAACAVDPEAIERARSEGRHEVAEGIAKEARELVAGVVAQAERNRSRAEGYLAQMLDQLKCAGDAIGCAGTAFIHAKNALREPIEVPESRISLKDYARDHAQHAQPRATAPVRTISPKRGFRPENTPSPEGINGPMQRCLDAIAWLESAGLAGPFSREQIATHWAGSRRRGSSSIRAPAWWRRPPRAARQHNRRRLRALPTSCSSGSWIASTTRCGVA